MYPQNVELTKYPYQEMNCIQLEGGARVIYPHESHKIRAEICEHANRLSADNATVHPVLIIFWLFVLNSALISGVMLIN